MSDDSSDPGDPFERLGEDDREGDPFERLDDETPGGDQSVPVEDDPWVPPGEDRRNETGDSARDPGPPSEAASAADDVDSASSPTPTDGPGDPFADVATPAESAFEEAGSVFEHVDAGSVDPDDVWESITGADEDEGESDAEPSVPDAGRYSDVSKHRFCEQCEHFSPPPDVGCSHCSAEIIEFLDMETVRLLDCPVVAEREELEERD